MGVWTLSSLGERGKWEFGGSFLAWWFVVFSVQYMVCLGRLDDHTRRRKKKIKSMDTGVAQAKFFFARGFLSVMVRSNVSSRTSFSEGRCCRETAAWVLCCCVCVEKRGQKLTGTRGWLGAKGGSLIPAMISSARLPWKRKSGLGLDAGAVEQCGEQMGFGAGLCCDVGRTTAGRDQEGLSWSDQAKGEETCDELGNESRRLAHWVKS